MKNWQVYQGKYGGLVVIKVGFNLWAFFFPVFWAFAKGLMVQAFGTFIAFGMISRLSAEQGYIATLLLLGIMTLFGIKGNAWYISYLKRDGYQFSGEVKAGNKKSAYAEAKLHYGQKEEDNNTDTPTATLAPGQEL